MIIFKFDQSKSQANLVKYGIDFIDAQQLWNDLNLLEISAKTIDEPRSLLIGRINNKYWSSVIYQDGNIRIILVRRSRLEEVSLYER